MIFGDMYKTYDRASINCKNRAIEVGLIQIFGTSAALLYFNSFCFVLCCLTVLFIF